MYDILLIERTDIQKYCQLSNSSKNDKLDQSIKKAQLLDVKPLLGTELFNAVLKDVSDTGNTNGTIYTELLNGGYYTVNGNEYYHEGLKSVLAHYSYGRYVMFGDVIDNPFGATRKLGGTSSEPVDYQTKKSFFQESGQTAFNLWVDVKRYLIYTKNDLFDVSDSTQRRNLKITKVGKRNQYNNKRRWLR